MPTRNPILFVLTFIFAVSMLINSCYIGPNAPILSVLENDEPPAYKLYPGKERPLSELSTVELTDVYYAQIDGLTVNRTDYKQVLLLPGEHVIVWGRWFAISVMVDADMSAEGIGKAKIDLEAGHTYELRADRTTGHNYQLYFWITDSSIGKIVSGTEKP